MRTIVKSHSLLASLLLGMASYQWFVGSERGAVFFLIAATVVILLRQIFVDEIAPSLVDPEVVI